MIADVHGWTAFVVIGLLAVTVIAAGLATGLDRGHRVVAGLAWMWLLLVAIGVLVGGVLFLSGTAPREGLHLLYGVALLGLVPLERTFAADAPPRARSGVRGVVALIALVLVWRLFTTG